MKYTEEFKNKCKQTYPDWDRLHEKLDEGCAWVGRYLSDSRSSISYKTILQSNSLEELKSIALKEKQKTDLYTEWNTNYNHKQY